MRRRTGADSTSAGAGRRVERLWLRLTDQCDGSCGYCYQTRSPVLLDAGLLMHRVREFAHLEMPHVVIEGGEASLHPHLLDIVRGLRGVSSSVTLISNGRGHLATLLDELAESGLSLLILSLDSADESLNDALRFPGSFRAVTNRVSDLRRRALRPQVGVSTVVGPENLSSLPRLIQWAGEVGVESIGVSQRTPRSGRSGELFEHLRARLEDLEPLAQCCGVQLVYPAECCAERGACAARQGGLHIHADGGVSPCAVSPYRLGHLRFEPIARIIASDAARSFSCSPTRLCSAFPHRCPTAVVEDLQVIADVDAPPRHRNEPYA